MHLVEALADRFLRDRDVVVPDLFPERVHPRQLFVVHPGLARTRVDDGEVGPRRGQHVVLEGHDARDRVHVARFQLGEERVEFLVDGGPVGGGDRERYLGLVEEPPAITLDVDDDGVELGFLEQIEHARADRPIEDAVVGEVGGLDGLRLQHDLERLVSGREGRLFIAG